MTDRTHQHQQERDAQRYKSTRLWNKTPNKLGMQGEQTLAAYFGAEPDLRNRPAGDDGIDLELMLNFNGTPEWFELDVKTANFPVYLLVNTKKLQHRRIYVLSNGTTCLGWEWGHEMALEPTQPWSGNDAITHYKLRTRLRPMSALTDRYCQWWRHHGLRKRLKSKK